MKTSVAVIGANGFVGQEICKFISQKSQLCLIPITRTDNCKRLLEKADIVIHAANSARRFSAEKDPEKDYYETVIKTFEMLSYSIGKKFILISSLSCKTQMNINYGRNRKSCELLALQQSAIIIRLGPMYGGNRKLDALHDLLAERCVYLAPETRYAYVDVEWAGKKIVDSLNLESGIYEIGAHNAISLAEIRDHFHLKCEFLGRDDTQTPDQSCDGPDAYEILRYAEKELKTIEIWNGNFQSK
jgi:nucleoside-diphosphate-sugar epimerase